MHLTDSQILIFTPPNSDSVVSRNHDSSILSLYSDDVWDLTPISTARCVINFRAWTNRSNNSELDDTIVNELKTIAWCYLKTNIRDRRSAGTKTIASYIAYLKPIALLASNLNLTLTDCHKSKVFLKAFRSSVVSSKRKSKFYVFLSRALRDITLFYNAVPDFQTARIFDSESLKSTLDLIEKQLNKALPSIQTPLIPTRILSQLIASTEAYIEAVQPKLENFISLAERYATDPFFWATVDSNSKFYKTRNNETKFDSAKLISPEDALETYSLQEFDFSTRRSKASFQMVKKFMSDIQDVCAAMVHVYTGMRAHEVSILRYDCLDSMNIEGLGEFFFISGYSSKLSGGNYASGKLRWATCREIVKFIKCAQAVTRFSAALNRFDPELINDGSLPLFASIEPEKTKPNPHSSFAFADLNFNFISKLEGDFLIQESDLVELETFDVFSDWRENKIFTVGSLWPFSTHQFRRSAAVYASRSGKVSLPSLQTQFKHLSTAMTLLYSENSSFACNFIQSDDLPTTHGVVTDFLESQSLNTAVLFEEQVLVNAGSLSGGRGALIQQLKDESNIPSILSDRKSVAALVKSGQLSYTDTVVGGCMRKTLCEHYGVDEVLPCLAGCKDAVINVGNSKKLVNYKSNLEMNLSQLSPGSRPYNTIVEEIVRLDQILKLESSDEKQ